MQNINPNHPHIEQTSTPVRRVSSWAALCATLSLAACASLGSGPENQVTQRATERWQALVSADFSRAYTFSTPGFKAIIPDDAFRSRFGKAVQWVGAEVVNVNCPEAAKCIANIRLDFKPLIGDQYGDTLSTHMNETWLLEDAKWWLFQPLDGK